MTASERPANQPHLDAPVAVPGHPGRWRVVSLVAVAVAALVVTISIAQDRQSTNDAPPGEDALQFTDVTIDPAVYDNALLHASALNDTGSNTGAGTQEQASGTTMVPITPHGLAMVTAVAPTGELIGLAINDPASTGTALNAYSTAQTLLLLSPALLDHDVSNATRSAALISDDPMHAALIEAVTADPALARSNDALGSSLAALLDRVPLRSPTPDQGCDSVSNSRAYPLVGTCVQPGTSSTTIRNEQDRWVLVYGEPDGWTTICSVLPPAAATNDTRSVSATECGARALLLTAGQLPTDPSQLSSVATPLLMAHHDAATALMLLDNYVLPYAAMTAGIDGYSDRAAVAPASVPVIVKALSQLMASDQLALDAVRAAYDPDSTPAVRQSATARAARAMLNSDELLATLPTEVGERAHALALLDFYDFTSSFMTAERSGPTWTASAAGIIDGL